ncbi:MAG TPA: DeoR/GlpR family DNA-binding transcription regulator [Paenirhodobacter sp.]
MTENLSTEIPDAAPSRLSKAERQDRIIAELGNAPALRASELALRLGVSHETIRRDLMHLDEQGQINRTYGGAARPFGSEPPLRERRDQHVAERQRIAARFVPMISPGEVLLLGAGSTTWHLARLLAGNCRDITVITNDMAVASALCTNPDIRTILLAGRVHQSEGYVYGSQTILGISAYNANWAVVGATGIGPTGAFDADDEAAGIYGAMVRRAAQSVVIADASKIDQSALAVFATWNDIDLLITDRAPGADLASALTHGRTGLLIAPDI